MEITKFNIPVIPDNETHYFTLLEAVIAAVDPYSSLAITRSPHCYTFRLAPSLPSFINPLIEQMLILHNLLGIQLNFSKSIKTTHSICFDIDTK